MASRRKKEPFYGDTYNSFDKTNRNFHWSKEYSWYSGFLVDDKSSSHPWMTELTRASCMTKVFNVPELVLWCSKHFDTTTRVIHVG